MEQVEVVLDVGDFANGAEWIKNKAAQVSDVLGGFLIQAVKSVLGLVQVELGLVPIIEGLEGLDGVVGISLRVLHSWQGL